MSYWGLRALPGFVLALLFLFVTLAAQAQTPSSVTPESLTPEQIQAFQNLTPDQQQAIMDAIAKSSGTTNQTEPTGTTEGADKARPGVNANGQPFTNVSVFDKQ